MIMAAGDTPALAAVFHGMVRTIAEVLDADDAWPASHAGRVAAITRRMVTAMGRPDAAPIYYAALLHDIGGCGLDEHITAHAERDFAEPSAQAHPRLGAELVGSCALLAPLRELIELHHERHDGAGFPFGRGGSDLPVGAAVIHVADLLERRLRVASPDQHRPALAAALGDASRGLAPRAVVDGAWAVFTADPDLVDSLFDPSTMASVHATPVADFPGLAGIDATAVITPLLLLLARVLDSRGQHQPGHSARVAGYGFHIAQGLGADVVDPWDVAWAGLLHGVGAIATPQRRRGPRRDGTPQREQRRAVEVVTAMPGLSHLARAIGAIHAHHDGSGWPTGLAGEQIPLIAQILAYADRYDDVTSYQHPGGPQPHPTALARVRDLVGTALDPHLADLALATLDRVAAVPPEPPPPDRWYEYFAVRAPTITLAAPSAGTRPPARGALLIELEPWHRVELAPALDVTAGQAGLVDILNEALDGPLAPALADDSVTELRALIARVAQSGEVATGYLFSRRGRPVEVVITAADGARVSALARAAVNRLQTIDRLAMFYRNFLASTEGVVFADPTGRILDVNRAFLDLYGYSLREVIGQHTRMLKSGRQPETFYRQMWAAVTDPAVGSWTGELVDRRRDGRELHVQLRISAVRDASGGCIGYIAHHQDITDRKRAEAELERRDAELTRKNAELERLNQFKTDMVAVTSHDLKSPLAAIVGVASLLARNLDRLPPERVTTYLERIGDTARSLTSFINDLLDLERIESGALALDRVPLRLDALLHEVAEQARSAAQGRVSIEVATSPGLPAVVADPLRLEQVLANLVTNACKFSPDDGVVAVSARGDAGDHVRVEVEDRGPGVPPHELDAIFDRYYQAVRKGGTSKRGSGSGLGLSIVRSLVELHGGRVWAENRAGGGCRFVVELPDHADDPMCGRPVALLLSPLTGAAMEATDHLVSAGAIIRRVETLAELRRQQRVLRPGLVIVARHLLHPDVVAHLELAPGAGDRRPVMVVLDEDGAGTAEAGLLDNVLAPPILPDEIRAILRQAAVA